MLKKATAEPFLRLVDLPANGSGSHSKGTATRAASRETASSDFLGAGLELSSQGKAISIAERSILDIFSELSAFAHISETGLVRRYWNCCGGNLRSTIGSLEAGRLGSK